MTDTKTPIGGVLGHGRYEVKRKLGEGGMAFALLAVDKTLGADVVLKVPKPNMMADPEFVRRFKREIRSMQELTHDHIVKIKDVGEHEGTPFYVMDLLAGGSLQDRFEAGADKKIKPMPPDSLADWLPQVADALDFIHQKFVHRDIKPANILFDAYGHAFVSDFGIVKAISDGSGQTKQTVMTQAGMVIGTAAYMAPELSEGKKVDGRVDQYALAVTVYEALSGRVPFEGTSYIEVIRQQLIGNIQPLHELVPELPRSLTQVIQKGLSLEAKERYGTCAEFAKAVQATVKRMPATIKAKGTPKAVCPTCRKPFALPPDPAGKSVTCPACGAGFTVAKKPSKKAAAETKNNPTGIPLAKPVEPLATLFQPPTMRQERVGRKPTRKAGFANRRMKILLIAGGILMLFVTCLIGLWAGGAFRAKSPQGAPMAQADEPAGNRNMKQPLAKKRKEGPVQLPPVKEKAGPVQLPPAKEKGPVAPAKSITNTIGMKLVYIPPGKFMMGSPLEEERAPFNVGSESRHEVILTKGFYIGAFAVTQGEYETVMRKNPSYFSATGNGKNRVAGLDTRRFPVERVTWDEAAAFCLKLSRIEEKTYRLPTEAEWEYACRAGTATPFHFGATISTDQANYDGNSVYGSGAKGEYRMRPLKVGSFTPNAWGLYDMHGNVWQWCEDWYEKGYYKSSPKIDPVNEDPGRSRVLRGGAWVSKPISCRSACRDAGLPDGRYEYFGFRVVLSELAAKETESPPAKTPMPPPVQPAKQITNTVGMKLAYIPPGKFMMGSPKEELERDDNELQHEVELAKGFYMGVYAVTQDEYQTVMGVNPSWFSAQGGGKAAAAGLDTRRFPVERANWDDAKEFCRKLSAKEGKMYRLPTAAEWEYACRAGTTTPFNFGETVSTDQANYDGSFFVYGNGVKGKYRARTMKVGSFVPNAWTLNDMHGNVWQWCEDWYDAKLYRVVRGGSWNVRPGYCRSSCRHGHTPDARYSNIGFRVVLSIP